MLYTYSVYHRVPTAPGRAALSDVVRSDGRSVRTGMWPEAAALDCYLLNLYCFERPSAATLAEYWAARAALFTGGTAPRAGFPTLQPLSLGHAHPEPCRGRPLDTTWALPDGRRVNAPRGMPGAARLADSVRVDLSTGVLSIVPDGPVVWLSTVR